MPINQGVSLLRVLMKIYYYEEASSAFDHRVILELKKYSDVQFSKASDKLASALNKWDTRTDLNSTASEALNYEDCRILIVCENGSKFYHWCIAQCSHAKWGCSNEYISVDYSPNGKSLYNQLHECLHFLGVVDCYEESFLEHQPKQSCDNGKCVMRYGVSSTEVCSSVQAQIQELANKSSKRTQ